MPNYRLTVPYKSGWYTVVLPTLITLGVWAGVFLGSLAFLDWNVPNWLGILLFFGGFVPGLAAAVLSYRFLLRLAERGRGEVVLEGDRLRWRTGRRWKEVDFAQPYKVEIAAGYSGLGEPSASITIYPEIQNFILRGVRREEVLAIFPEPYFVKEQVFLPEEGIWGFDFSANDPQAASLFADLVKSLWLNRQQNELYRLYQKFPWHRRPQPAFRHIRFIETNPKKATPEERIFLENLKAQVVCSLRNLEVTPDYLIGWYYYRRRGKLVVPVSEVSYAVMPLGYISAELSLRDSESPYRFLFVRGSTADGTPLELAFEWYETQEYEVAEFIVRFVEAMREQQ